MELKLVGITKELLPAFTPYLLPQAAEAVAAQEPGLIALGAVSGSKTCGAVAGLSEDGELDIFSLYVDGQVRRKGIGSKLLNELLCVACCKAATAHWILPPEEYAAAESFFISSGFSSAESGDDIYRLSSADFRKAASLRSAFSPLYRPDGNIVPASEFTDEEILELLADESIPGFLRLDSFTPEELLEPTCLGYRYRGRISAYFICTVSSEDSVALRAALSREGAPPAAFQLLTAAAIKQVIAQLGEDFSVFLSPVTAPSMRLTQQLSGGRYEIWTEGSCSRRSPVLGKKEALI